MEVQESTSSALYKYACVVAAVMAGNQHSSRRDLSEFFNLRSFLSSPDIADDKKTCKSLGYCADFFS